jgi:beta-lactam-binding protein with PASTA domain
MEYVKGRSLRDVLQSEEILPERAAEIVGQAALALHYAHERGLVHRDVKPANIMISDDGQVKVADFGIARAVNAETVTQTATVFGTAAYISPEQAQGAPVDRRSDIYSLGVVLYEMLAHRPPFEGDSAVALAYKHVSSEPVPPSQLNPEVSAQLDAVVRKAMAKHPADRYQTARELHDDLRRAVAGLSVSAPPPPAYAMTQAITYPNGDRTLVAPPYAPGQTAAPSGYGEQRGRGPVLGWVLLALLIILLFGAAAYFIRDLGRNEQFTSIEVPDVSGLGLTEAQEILAAAGFRTTIVDPQPSEEREGTVLRTEPRAGDEALKGSRVTIVPSSGPIPIPEVTGQSPTDAETTLRRAGLTPGQRRAQGSNTVREGRVIGTDPPESTPVGPETGITLIVSSGPSGITVPDVAGLDESTARERILAACPNPACVSINVQRVPNDDVAEGDVIGSNPAAGQQVEFGNTVTLQVSEGPIDPSPQPSPVETLPDYDPPIRSDGNSTRPDDRGSLLQRLTGID